MIIEYRKVGEQLQFRERGTKFRSVYYPQYGATLTQTLSLFLMGLEYAGVEVEELVEVE